MNVRLLSEKKCDDEKYKQHDCPENSCLSGLFFCFFCFPPFRRMNSGNVKCSDPRKIDTDDISNKYEEGLECIRVISMTDQHSA